MAIRTEPARASLRLPALLLAVAASALAGPPSRAHAIGWPGLERSLAQELEAAPPARRVELLSRIAATPGAGADEVLVRALRDDDASVRLAAAGHAGRRRITAAAVVLAGWLDEPQAGVRAEAARALGLLGQRSMLPSLVRLLGDAEVDVRLAAVEALARMGGADATVPLLDRLSDPETRVRLAAVRALGQAGDARAVLSLLGTLQDTTPEVRKEVATALGNLRDPRGFRGLLGLLRDPQLEVRLAAVQALGSLGVADAAVDLLPLALREDTSVGDPAARSALARAAVDAIGRIGVPDARVLLARVFRRAEGDRDVSRAAGDVLRTLGAGDGQVIAVVSASPVADAAVVEVATLLGDLGGDAAADAIVAMYESPQGVVHGDVLLRALGRTGAPRALRVLLRVAQSDAPGPRDRRMSAIAGLESLARARGSLDPEALDPLVTMLAEGAPPGLTPEQERGRRAALLGLLGATENPRASRYAAPFLRSPHAPLRASAARVLGRAGVEGVEAEAAQGLADADPAVRLALTDGFVRTGGAPAVEALVRVWAGTRPIDRASAARALGRSADRVPALRDRAATLLGAALDDASLGTAAACLDGLASLAAAGSSLALAYLRASLDIASLAGSAAEALANAASSAAALEPAQRTNLADALRSATAPARAPEVRAAAAWGLGRLGASAWADLRPLLNDPDTSVAINVVGSVAAHGAAFRDEIQRTDPDEVSRRALFCPLAERRAPALRANALLASARLGIRCDAIALRAALTEGRAPFVRAAAAEALGLLQGPGVRAPSPAAPRTPSPPSPAATTPAASAPARPELTPAERDALLDAAVLDRCVVSEGVAWVARRCRRAVARETEAAPAPAPPRAGAPLAIDAALLREEDGRGLARGLYWLLRSDGVLRAGVTGPDGWIHERPAPPGTFRVYEPDLFAPEL